MNHSLSLHRHGLVILCLVFTFPSGSPADPGKEAKQPFARILKELQSPDAAVRAAAAEKLKTTTVPTDKASILSLGRLLVNKDYTVASAAETTLKRMGGAGVPALAELLLDKESTPELRDQILLLFCDLGPRAKGATTAILQRLQCTDLDGDESFDAGEALKAIGPHAVPLIVRTFPKCDDDGQSTLIESLEDIIGEDVAGKYRLPPPMYQQVIPLFLRGLVLQR
jgi:HEAT repeat protein